MGRLDARQIIEQIMADPRLARGGSQGGCFTSRVYEDEPILRTGSQMAGYLPPAYRAARDISRGLEANRRGRAWLFREQGLVLADVEDDCPYRGTFEGYCPTYQSMSDRQLRGYVTWRTGVRRGRVEAAPLPFVFVYIYELLNGIGVASPVEGFDALLRFWQVYRELDAVPNRYVRPWLYDYVAYHGLDAGLVWRDEALAADLEADRSLLRVLDPAGLDEEALFAAYAALSSYRVANSRLYRERPEDVRHVTLAVLDRLAAYYRKNRKYGLDERLFGAKMALPYQMFSAAVFYEVRRHEDAVYEFDPIRRFVCRRGTWTYERYPSHRGSSSKLGAVLKAVDARLRARLSFPYPLKEQGTPKYLAQIIDREIDAWLAWKQAHAPRHIEIDRSKLGGIRRAAAETCEELLVDEERLETAEGAGLGAGRPAPVLPDVPFPAAAPSATGTSPACPEAVAGTAVPEGASPPTGAMPSRLASAPPLATTPGSAPAVGLTSLELAFLRRLLAGQPYADLLKGAPATSDMLVDAINEKLFDVIGDTALGFDGAAPAIIEDYLEDVKGVVQP